jgi:glutaminase
VTINFSAASAAVQPSPILDYLAALHARLGGLAEGKVADYIPELTHADPEWFGICVATRDGFVYEIGDTGKPFTLQSISKPLTYGLALEDNGEDAVLAKIGVEPSGEAFNAISLRPQNGAPLNPLINASAIAACGLVAGDTVMSKMTRILDAYSRYAGRQLDIDEPVYRSESATGHRNRAIGWMLRNFAILADDPTPTLETYFRQCSMRVTCRDLAVIGVTLANGGVNPVTRVRAIAPPRNMRESSASTSSPPAPGPQSVPAARREAQPALLREFELAGRRGIFQFPDAIIFVAHLEHQPAPVLLDCRPLDLDAKPPLVGDAPCAGAAGIDGSASRKAAAVRGCTERAVRLVRPRTRAPGRSTVDHLGAGHELLEVRGAELNAALGFHIRKGRYLCADERAEAERKQCSG